MKKTFQIKYLIIIICVTLASVILLFIGDSYFKKDYENPLRVAEAFAYSLMVKDKHTMKSWSYKEIHDKIDKLEPSQFTDEIQQMFDSHFRLVCFRRLNNSIICTYALSDVGFLSFNAPPLFYTVVLLPLGPNSLWERVKEFVRFEIPLGDSIITHTHSKQRWLVVDYYTEDDYDEVLSQVLITFKTFDQSSGKNTSKKFDTMKFVDEIITGIQSQQAYQNQWREQEKVEQNSQMRKLYKNYHDGVDNKVKEN